jgi:NAD(P)H-flavin reductase
MVAGGVGLAPFVTLALRLQQLGTPSTLFYGARSAAELYYVEIFERLGVHVVPRPKTAPAASLDE